MQLAVGTYVYVLVRVYMNVPVDYSCINDARLNYETNSALIEAAGDPITG